MPASAVTTGRTAASPRAAIAVSADVSVSTIQNHADVAAAPLASMGPLRDVQANVQLRGQKRVLIA